VKPRGVTLDWVVCVGVPIGKLGSHRAKMKEAAGWAASPCHICQSCEAVAHCPSEGQYNPRAIVPDRIRAASRFIADEHLRLFLAEIASERPHLTLGITSGCGNTVD
jgi:hypothetical protein